MALPFDVRTGACSDKLRLAEEFVTAVQDVMKLQDGEMAEMVSGGDGLSRFDLALNAARRKRDEAKRAYMVHIHAHGC